MSARVYTGVASLPPGFGEVPFHTQSTYFAGAGTARAPPLPPARRTEPLPPTPLEAPAQPFPGEEPAWHPPSPGLRDGCPEDKGSIFQDHLSWI